ncbi:MAG: hypothetical protein ACTJHU_06190 [Mycetocola sp.]
MMDVLVDFLALIAAILALWMLTHVMCSRHTSHDSSRRPVLFGVGINILAVLVGSYVIVVSGTAEELPFSVWEFFGGGMIGICLGAVTAFRRNARATR